MLRLLKYAVIAILGITLFACSSSGDAPEKVATEYMQAFVKADIDKVMKLAYIESDGKKEEETKKMMRGKVSLLASEMANKAKERGGVKEITAAEAVYSEDKTTAEVEVTIVFKDDGEPAIDTVDLVKSNGKWLVKLFK